ncbi:MAG: ACP S-malonyltransferase [Pseudomonadota bacterium]
MTRKRTAMVICPGRGVYNAAELGYFQRHHADKARILASFDAQRAERGQTPLADLDGADRFVLSKFTRGDNASGLIYACSWGDFLSIDRNAFDVVAVTGNSMGWYTTLACGGALTGDTGFEVVNTMGTIMQEDLIGGQLIYPFVDEHWREIPGAKAQLLDLVSDIEDLHVSIYLGGMVVLAGLEPALEAAEGRLAPLQDRYPMRLANHAAFHTPLLSGNAERGRSALPPALFSQPDIPMIDGRGHVWLPRASDLESLWTYTLGQQVTETYNYTNAVISGLHEFAPDIVIILGPGTTLGGATAQAMIASEWHGITSKADFIARQKEDPIVLSMGMDDQRDQATGASSPQ